MIKTATSLQSGNFPAHIQITAGRKLAMLPALVLIGTMLLAQPGAHVAAAAAPPTWESQVAETVANGKKIIMKVPSGTADDDLLIAVVMHGDDAEAISAPAGWTLIDSGACDGNNCIVGVWYKVADSEASTYKFTWSSKKRAAGVVLRYSGADPDDPIDLSGNDTATSSTPMAPDIATTVANTMVLRIAGTGDSVLDLPTDVYPPGHDGRVAVEIGPPPPGFYDAGMAAADTTQVSVGATGTAAFGLTSSTAWRTVTIAIKPVTTYNLDFTVVGDGSVSGDGDYNHGDTADTSSVVADSGSNFDGWSGPDGVECATGSVSMIANKKCTATFTRAAAAAAVNANPEATILAPAFYVSLLSTDIITFIGLGLDAEDGNLIGDSLVWTSNIDGLIGTGESFETTLSGGTHTITLEVIDLVGGTSDAIVIFEIVGPPRVEGKAPEATAKPTVQPTPAPTVSPIRRPVATPTLAPIAKPTTAPPAKPTAAPKIEQSPPDIGKGNGGGCRDEDTEGKGNKGGCGDEDPETPPAAKSKKPQDSGDTGGGGGGADPAGVTAEESTDVTHAPTLGPSAAFMDPNRGIVRLVPDGGEQSIGNQVSVVWTFPVLTKIRELFAPILPVGLGFLPSHVCLPGRVGA